LGSHRADRVVTLPNAAQAAVDDRGHFTASWRNWLAQIERTLSAAGGNTDDLAAAISTIATALGSPDGTVANIPEQASLDFAILSPDNTIAITGTPQSGSVLLGLRALADSGVGAALVKITRDAYGRVDGTHSATTDDLTEGSTNKYYTDERAQDAVGAAFAAGTQTGCTVTYNDAANSLSINVTGGGGGAMSLVTASTVAGAAVTSVTLSGLDLSTDKCYLLLVSLGNPTGSASIARLQYNGDTTAGNYFRRYMTTRGAAGGDNTADLSQVAAGGRWVAYIWIRRDLDGRPVARVSSALHTPGSILGTQDLQDFVHIHNDTTNVTSITINASVASSIAIGSELKLYKVV
jgi:hypothetical protein